MHSPFQQSQNNTRFLKIAGTESKEFLRNPSEKIKSCIIRHRTGLEQGDSQVEMYAEQTENKAPRVLIVDDNPEIREIIHILLGGEGYELEEAKNGDEALRKAEENAFDLIILDIMMPGMDGYHTCMEIRKESNAPILFLSAKTQEGDKMLGFSSGGDD